MKEVLKPLTKFVKEVNYMLKILMGYYQEQIGSSPNDLAIKARMNLLHRKMITF